MRFGLGTAALFAAFYGLTACGERPQDSKTSAPAPAQPDAGAPGEAAALVRTLRKEIGKSRVDGVAIAYAESLERFVREEGEAVRQRETIRARIRADLEECKRHGLAELKSDRAREAFAALCKRYGVEAP